MIGHLTWEGLTVLHDEPIINGTQLGNMAEYAASTSPGGAGVHMLNGTTVKQDPAGHPDAPRNLAAEAITIGARLAHEDDYLTFLKMKATAAQGVEVFIQEPLVDAFRLRGTTRAEWTISRSFPYGLPQVDWNAFPSAVSLVDPTGAQADIILTPVETPPAAGEVQILRDVTSSTMITSDLSAYAGRWMQVLYYPIRICSIGTFDKSSNEADGLAFVVTFNEEIPSRTYGDAS